MTTDKKRLSAIVKKLGLNQKEAEFYLALLQTGPATVSPIAKQAGLKRTSVYNFIDRLIELGLVSVFIKNNHHYYRAENPEYINQILAQQKKEVEAALPDLVNLFKAKDYHPQTKLFYGLAGMKKVLYEALECKEKKIYTIIDIPSAVGNLGVKFWNDYTAEVIKRGIIAHSLRHEEEKTAIPDYKFLKKDNYQNSTLVPRYLPKEIHLPNTIFIYDNKVAIISPARENWALVVESKSFSESMKVIHNILWNISK